jgi:hypothetical protein
MLRKAVALIVVTGAAFAASAALADAPLALTGEFFSPGTAATADTCSGSGGTATFVFSGPASGPYPGTYTETMSISYGVASGGVSSMTGTATFAIDSGVTGTKSLSGAVDCVNGEFFIKFGGTYSATLLGAFHDEGTTGSGAGNFGLNESFTSTLPAPTPLLPTSKDQCKNGGWRSFGVFKNQGDCVSFVATGGKNTPG